MLKQVLKQFFQKNNLLLVILIVLGILVRFLWIDKIPVGITHDDADVVLSAQSFWSHGVDASGTSFPSSLFFNKTPGKISGLPSFLLSPFVGIFGLNLLNIHLIYIFVNLLTILFIGLFVYRFTGSIKTFLLVIFVSLFNPWLFAYSRYPTEAPFALLFVFVGIYFLFNKKPYGVFTSTIFFILSFYSYFGAKVVIPIVYPILLAIKFFESKKDPISKNHYIAALATFLLAVGGYFFIVLSSPQSTFSQRATGEFVFSDMSLYQSQVNEIRRASIDLPFKNLIFNKYTLLFKDVAVKYLGWSSPSFLFESGDPVSVYRFEEYGLFYFLDAIFILLGIFYLARFNNNKINNLILTISLFLIVAPIGSAISRIGSSYFFRSFLLIPVLVCLIAFGLNFVLNNVPKIISGFFLLIYILFFVNFLAFYFLRYPIKQQDNQFLEGRILSSYLKRAGVENRNFTVFTTDPLSIYHLYTFYNGLANPHILTSEDQFADITDANLKLTSDCKYDISDELKIFETKLNCPKISGDYVVIQNQKDAGSQFVIYNDKVCSNQNLEVYRRNHLISDFAIEKMTDQEFCNRWIFKKN